MRKSFEVVIQRRIVLVLLFFFIASGILVSRLFTLQVVNHKEYVELAERQHRFVEDVLSERGMILAQDKNGDTIPVALNKLYKNVAASPINIKNSEEAALILAAKLDLDEGELRARLEKKDDPYEIIARKVDEKIAEEISKSGLEGVFLEEEKRRFYPQGALASHLLGFVSREKDEEEGRYGLERYYEHELAGERGIFDGIRDAGGFWIALGRRIVRPPRNGSNLVLTLDYNIQQKAQDALKSVFVKWQAKSGSILVTDPKTGRILAMASYPTFDPNEFNKEKDLSVFLNPLVERQYELGSVVKPITMAAGLAEGKINPQTTYEDPGEIRIGPNIIRNFDGRSYKTQTMTQVLEKSLNTGAVYAARLLGKEKQKEYLRVFGLGENMGIDLPGEVAGDISNLEEGREIDFATASFGQGIAMTPLQLASAIGAIANGGRLMKPYAVDKIVDDSGNEVKNEPEVVRQVILKEDAETLTKMLVSAVRNGFENRAAVKGYFVAGKTGTAQIPKEDGPGYSDKVIHSFVGYAPAFDPKFLVYLQLNEPVGNRFAANTLTPAFQDLAEYILNYYEVPPDEK